MHTRAEFQRLAAILDGVSNVRAVRGSSSGGTSASNRPFRPPAATGGEPAPSFPNAAGTAVLNLTGEQTSRIGKLLIGLRNGKAAAEDVRENIWAMLSGSQRRMLGAAYFIISVRV